MSMGDDAPRRHDGRDSDDESGDDDDLADVPDTREFTPLDVEGLRSVGIGGTLPDGLTMKDLENMTSNGAGDIDGSDEDEEDEEDLRDVEIQQTDAVLVLAKAEEDYASLEVNVYDTTSSSLYVHHDIPLPSFPLCLALGSVVRSYGDENSGTKTGNYVAIGSFEPGIEIWNLDVMNALEPTLVLGGSDTSGAEEEWMRMQMPGGSAVGGPSKKKNKRKNQQQNDGLREGSHTDAVMSLSWNSVHRQVLASGSADCTVKLWDVASAGDGYVRPSATLSHHSDKVNCVSWHPSEGTLLATAGYDRRVCLVDARSASSSSTSEKSVKRAKVASDPEALAWDPHCSQYLTAATEDGTVQCWDVRKFDSGAPVWSFVAHEFGGVSDLTYNPSVPGMLVTVSVDKTVALWDTASATEDGGRPHQCGSKDMNVGRLHSVSVYPDSKWLLSCGGGGNEVAIWAMESEEAVVRRFGDRSAEASGDDVVAAGVEESATAADAGEPNFEEDMARGDDGATAKAIESMNKSKKKKGKKKKKKAHKK